MQKVMHRPAGARHNFVAFIGAPFWRQTCLKCSAMLERLLLPDKHAIALLLKDHDAVKELFDRFEKTDSRSEKENIIRQALAELKVHAVIEEEIFYPAVRKTVGEKLMNEADEEHHVARVLIAELDINGRGDDHRMAKFKVLAESVRHHIKEEEGEVLPKAKELEIDFESLGRQMLDRKKELKAQGVPPDAEHAMVEHAGGKADTPAQTASSRKPMATRSSHSHSTASSKGKRKVHKVMKEHKRGTLKSGSGKKVTSRKQAVAIALSEARRSGARIPKKKK